MRSRLRSLASCFVVVESLFVCCDNQVLATLGIDVVKHIPAKHIKEVLAIKTPHDSAKKPASPTIDTLPRRRRLGFHFNESAASRAKVVPGHIRLRFSQVTLSSAVQVAHSS